MGFMVEVDAIALTVGKVRNATFTILNASLLIAPNMGSVVKGYASVILVGPVNIAKHVSILYYKYPTVTAKSFCLAMK